MPMQTTDDDDVLHERAYKAAYDIEFLFANKTKPLTQADVELLEAVVIMLETAQ